jgi:hypothetical protein
MTVKSRTRPKENPEFSGFVRRAIRAYSRRITEQGDIHALGDMSSLAIELDAGIRLAVAGLRERGYSWTDIGHELGTSRQAAQQKWGAR